MYIRIYKGHLLYYSLKARDSESTVKITDISYRGINTSSVNLPHSSANTLLDYVYINAIFPQHLNLALTELSETSLV